MPVLHIEREAFDLSSVMHVRSSIPRTAMRSGFTLIEGLMACGILLITVMAVSSALSAGQQHSLEARLKVAGSMAADDLMGRILVRPPSEIMVWHGFRENPGEMRTATGDPFPDHFRMIGREVSVLGTSIVLDDLGVTVSGRRIIVRIFDSTGRDLIVLERFLSAGGGG